jgi:hypothetical protein
MSITANAITNATTAAKSEAVRINIPAASIEFTGFFMFSAPYPQAYPRAQNLAFRLGAYAPAEGV